MFQFLDLASALATIGTRQHHYFVRKHIDWKALNPLNVLAAAADDGTGSTYYNHVMIDQDATPDDVSPVTAPRGSRFVPWLGLLLVLAGPVAYTALLDHPLLSRTGLPAWILMSGGVAVGLFAAWRQPRRLTRVLLGVDLVLVLVFLVGFFGLSALPGSPQLEHMARAPDFTLPDEQQRPVTLSHELQKGPVLLVFYRGFW